MLPRASRATRTANLFQRLDGIKTDGISNAKKLNHVDAPLPALDARNKRLVFAQRSRNIRLKQIARFALLPDQANHESMLQCSDGPHSRVIDAISRYLNFVNSHGNGHHGGLT